MQLLELGEVRDRAFVNLTKEHNHLAGILRVLKNEWSSVPYGKDGFIVKLSSHYRWSAILAGGTIETFLQEAYLDREPDTKMTYEPYSSFDVSNKLIDKYTSLDIESDEVGIDRGVVKSPSGVEISIEIDASQLLFCVAKQVYKEAARGSRGARAVVASERKPA